MVHLTHSLPIKLTRRMNARMVNETIRGNFENVNWVIVSVRQQLMKSQSPPRDCDWTPQMYKKQSIYLQYHTGPQTTMPGRSRAKMPGPSSLRWLCGQIHARTHSYDISVICPAISERLSQYCNPVPFLEFPWLSRLFGRNHPACLERENISWSFEFG
jgi:hypothetical protein